MYSNERGVSVVVVAVIVAMLAIGVVAVVQYQQRAAVDTTDAESEVIETINETRTEAVRGLLDIRADLAAGGDVDLSAARAFLTSVRRSLQDAYAEAGAEAQAELNALNSQIIALQTHIATSC